MILKNKADLQQVYSAINELVECGDPITAHSVRSKVGGSMVAVNRLLGKALTSMIDAHQRIGQADVVIKKAETCISNLKAQLFNSEQYNNEIDANSPRAVVRIRAVHVGRPGNSADPNGVITFDGVVITKNNQLVCQMFFGYSTESDEDSDEIATLPFILKTERGISFFDYGYGTDNDRQITNIFTKQIKINEFFTVDVGNNEDTYRIATISPLM